MRNSLVFIGLPLAALVLGCSDRRPAPSAPAAGESSSFSLSSEQRGKIRVLPVSRSKFTRTLSATGVVAFDQNSSTQVISAISGPVRRLLVQPGSRVAAGEPLAEVASPDFAADVSAYRKSLAAAKNFRRIADLDRRLFDSGGIPRRELDQAETDAISAEADRDAARQQLSALGIPAASIAEVEAGRGVPEAFGMIRSPISGTVVERLINPGQLLQAGASACFTIADLSRVWVQANVFPKDLPFVRVGDSAVVSSGSSSVSGRVDYIAALVDPNTRAVAVRVAAANPGEVLKRDAYVDVALRSREESAGILVPVSAVLMDDENLPFAFVEASDGTFSRRRVTLGLRTGDSDQVTDGLREGDRVVVDGGLFLQFAQSQ